MVEAQGRYFRREQKKGVTAPDLSRSWTWAEHITRARGKRSQLTSVSLDPAKIEPFGSQLFELDREALGEGAHNLIEHPALMEKLRTTARSVRKEERARAIIQAQRYARMRQEGLVEWRLDFQKVPRTDLIAWAQRQVQMFFRKVRHGQSV